jgi:hypothetical protein
MTRIGFTLAAAMLMAACTEGEKAEKAAPAPVKVGARRPADESRRFPKENLVESRIVERQLMGKSFMPGGTLGLYRKGRSEYELFLAKMPSANDAAIALLDWKRALADAKLVPAFGAYFGRDGERPVFVFTKGSWIAGVVGLNEKQADLPARELASRLSFSD